MGPAWTASEIHAILGELEVACSLNSVRVALSKAKNRRVIPVTGASGELRYAISHAGRVFLDQTDPIRGIEVWRAEPGNPWRGWLKLEELASLLKGSLRVVDPYYAEKSLYALEALSGRPEKVRLLTCHSSPRKGRSPAALDTQARALMRASQNIELRKVPAPAPFHDRYIVSNAEYGRRPGF